MLPSGLTPSETPGGGSGWKHNDSDAAIKWSPSSSGRKRKRNSDASSKYVHYTGIFSLCVLTINLQPSGGRVPPPCSSRRRGVISQKRRRGAAKSKLPEGFKLIITCLTLHQPAGAHRHARLFRSLFTSSDNFRLTVNIRAIFNSLHRCQIDRDAMIVPKNRQPPNTPSTPFPDDGKPTHPLTSNIQPMPPSLSPTHAASTIPAFCITPAPLDASPSPGQPVSKVKIPGNANLPRNNGAAPRGTGKTPAEKLAEQVARTSMNELFKLAFDKLTKFCPAWVLESGNTFLGIPVKTTATIEHGRAGTCLAVLDMLADSEGSIDPVVEMDVFGSTPLPKCLAETEKNEKSARGQWTDVRQLGKHAQRAKCPREHEWASPLRIQRGRR
ncbi:hypothetical protein B0H19DRAFT_1079447 [Mycena capillaripes]|nr:hypothetical protein B0H19DRAFT_1079447 [Mycena capillaripes]